MADPTGRKKWTKLQESRVALTAAASVKPTQPRAQDGYDKYLAILQERNRLLKKLRKKDSRQVEIEKREQGFSLYLNGANLSHKPVSRVLHHGPTQKTVTDISQPHPSKEPLITERSKSSRTADPDFGCGDGDSVSSGESSRAKSAPSKRKSWSHSTVRLKTADGELIKIPPPDCLSGDYEDDFEVSVTAEDIVSEKPLPAQPRDDGRDRDGEEERDGERGEEKGEGREEEGEWEEEEDEGEVEDETGEGGGDCGVGITVEFQDISALRESLESDSVIRKSILDSLCSSPDSGEESCSEYLEEDQEGESSLAPQLTSGRGIVLEFGPPSHPRVLRQTNPHNPVDNVVGALGSVGVVEQHQIVRKATDSSNISKPAIVQNSVNPKVTRSLSATVRKKPTSVEEDVAIVPVENVLEALQAENAMVDGAALKDGATLKKSTRSLSATVIKKDSPFLAESKLENVVAAVEAENTAVDDQEVSTTEPLTGIMRKRTSFRDILTSDHKDDDDDIHSCFTATETKSTNSPPTERWWYDSKMSGSTGGGKRSFPLKPVLLKYNTSKPLSLFHPPRPPRSGHSPGEERRGPQVAGGQSPKEETGRETQVQSPGEERRGPLVARGQSPREERGLQVAGDQSPKGRETQVQSPGEEKRGTLVDRGQSPREERGPQVAGDQSPKEETGREAQVQSPREERGPQVAGDQSSGEEREREMQGQSLGEKRRGPQLTEGQKGQILGEKGKVAGGQTKGRSLGEKRKKEQQDTSQYEEKPQVKEVKEKEAKREEGRVDEENKRTRKEGDLASQSLTEQTLKIITSKVRKMDAKQQFRLLDLLGKLEGQPAQFSGMTSTKHKPTPLENKEAKKGGKVKVKESKRKHSVESRERKSDTVDSDSKTVKADVGKAKEESRHEVLKRLLSGGGEDKPSLSDTMLAADHTNREEEEEVWRGCGNSKRRPISGRLTGLRGEIVSAGEVGRGEKEGELETSETDLPRPQSERTSGMRGVPRLQSGRTSGLRGEMMDEQHLEEGPLAGSRTALRSGRTTGLRGELTQQDVLESVKPGGGGNIERRGPRLHTAVLAHGRRPLLLGVSGSDTCLLPEITAETSHRQFTGKWLSRSEECLSPMPCDSDPQLSDSTHPGHAHAAPTATQLSVDDCLASISKFDHSHLGQMGHDLQDDVLESFLKDYRQKRKSGAEHSTTTTPDPAPSSPSNPTPHPPDATSPRPLDATATTDSLDWQQPEQPLTPEPQGGEEMYEEDNAFCIPELPIGRELVINILSTWGDRFYVGLTGIEVYTASGQLANVKRITADPSDINVLAEYDSDPRVVGNLLDGVNQTRDDVHMWLAPFTPGSNHLVCLEFAIPYALALVRIWNYNKSRIHSWRGARHIQMFLDRKMIFSGELARATGAPTANHLWENSETILFTTNEAVLERVSQYDPIFQSDTHPHLLATMPPEGDAHSPSQQRPSTAHFRQEAADDGIRPFTSANVANPAESVIKQTSSKMEDTKKLFGVSIEVILADNWGDPCDIGLTSIAVLEAGSRQPIALRSDQVAFSHPAMEGDPLTSTEAARLVDGVNITTEESHMWACPLPDSSPSPSRFPSLQLTLDTPTSLAGLRVWNYNASLEESYKGVKLVYIAIDGSPLSLGTGDGGEGKEGAAQERGFLVRRAPGHVQYDFAQDIMFDCTPQAQEPPSHLPRGFVFQLQLLGTWGDPYYVGLNGMEFYDEAGKKMPLTADNIAAFPDSVNALPDISNDLRTPDKLVDGVSDTMEGHHMWLAPVLPEVVNSVFVLFDQPQAVSEVRLWNYGKTPSRGVKEIALLVDDLLVFTGIVPTTPIHARGILPTLHMPIEPFLIKFPQDGSSPSSPLPNLSSPLTSPRQAQQTFAREEGDVQFVNNRQVVSEVKKSSKPVPNQDYRPFTSLTHTNQSHSKQWKH